MDKSIFILGAGASKDFCDIFPLGSELIKEINYHFITEENPDTTCREDYYLSALMNETVRTLPDDSENNKKRFKKIKNTLWKIQVGYETEYLRKKDILPLSIDSFVSTQMDDMHFEDIDKNIIKYCIYYLIKGYENAKTEQQGFERTWIYDLASKVSEFKADEIKNSLSVVTFNYDRVFENYFCNYLLCERVFNEGDNENFLKNNVRHVYSSLGNLNDV